jgi:ABC-2 type transport system ATP-binding protein
VALEKTSDLLSQASSNVLRFKTDQALPVELAAQARVTGRVVQLPAHNAMEVEQWLARAREAGVVVEDVEIRKADLEDVFIEVMERAGKQGQEAVLPPGRPKAERAPLGGSEGTAVPSVGVTPS